MTGCQLRSVTQKVTYLATGDTRVEERERREPQASRNILTLYETGDS